MKSKHLGNAGLCIGTMTLLLGSAVFIQAAPSSGASQDQSQKTIKQAARLLTDIRTDAMHIRSAALQLDSLTANSSATWVEYDRQWNEIKPSVEDMQIKLARLEGMQAVISPAERQELDQSKSLIGEVQGRTHQLRLLLDKPGVQTSDVKFKAYARSLRNEAGQLEKAAAAVKSS